MAEGTVARVWCLGREAREGGGGAACLGTDEAAARPGNAGLLLHAFWFEVSSPTPVTTVTVLDPAGRPMTDVRVSAHGRTERSDASGSAEFPGLPDEPFLPVVTWENARMPEDEGWVLPVMKPVRPGSSYVLQYRVGRRIEGRLTSPDGRPCAGSSLLVNNGWFLCAVLTTDADGRFSALVDPFPPAPYRVVVTGEGQDWTEFEHDFLPGDSPVTLTLDASR